jgi:hypothetical protein
LFLLFEVGRLLLGQLAVLESIRCFELEVNCENCAPRILTVFS